MYSTTTLITYSHNMQWYNNSLTKFLLTRSLLSLLLRLNRVSISGQEAKIGLFEHLLLLIRAAILLQVVFVHY